MASYHYNGVGIWRGHRRQCSGAIKGHPRRKRCMNYGAHKVGEKYYCSHHRFAGFMENLASQTAKLVIGGRK